MPTFCQSRACSSFHTRLCSRRAALLLFSVVCRAFLKLRHLMLDSSMWKQISRKASLSLRRRIGSSIAGRISSILINQETPGVSLSNSTVNDDHVIYSGGWYSRKGVANHHQFTVPPTKNFKIVRKPYVTKAWNPSSPSSKQLINERLQCLDSQVNWLVRLTESNGVRIGWETGADALECCGRFPSTIWITISRAKVHGSETNLSYGLYVVTAVNREIWKFKTSQQAWIGRLNPSSGWNAWISCHFHKQQQIVLAVLTAVLPSW